MQVAVNNDNYYSRINPKKFMLWMGIVSSIMMFAALTSAYLVKRPADPSTWTLFRMPAVFGISSLMVVLSSISLQAAWFFRNREKQTPLRVMMVLSALTAMGFAACQYLGWQQLQEIGIRLGGSSNGAFLMVIAGLHMLHLVGGLLIMAIVFVKYLRPQAQVQKLIDEVNPNRFLGLELLLTYWHFLGALWLYLYFFFSHYSELPI